MTDSGAEETIEVSGGGGGRVRLGTEEEEEEEEAATCSNPESCDTSTEGEY
jgi:hypothetical protein